MLGLMVLKGCGERLGAQVAEGVATRFAKMLAGKMRQEDSLGHFGAGQYAVVSPVRRWPCATFAERVREAVELAAFLYRVKRLR